MRLVQQPDPRAPTIKPSERKIVALTDAQRHYDAAMRRASIVFGIGPAGTGKTWLAVMRAAEAMKKGEIDRIVLTRPAVEAGESLGFLPGELEEKYEPYIRPVQDALEEAFGTTHLEYLMKTRRIDARPLAFLRGVTLKNCWLVADEMQNATAQQFKMLLSRIGENAKFIINGDPDQADIATSGLCDAVRRLEGIDGIALTCFGVADIVRSDLCQRIISAYASGQSVTRYNDERHNDEGLNRFLNVEPA